MNKISLFKTLIDTFINDTYREDVLRARKEYQEMTGVIKEDFPIFPERLDQFIEWYILEYELKGEELSPIDYYYETNILKLSSKEVDEILSLKNSILSIYKVLSVKKGILVLLDLVSSEKYKAIDINLEYSKILQKGDIITSRIYKFKSKYYLMDGVLSHPEESFNYIKKKINALKYFDRVYINSFIMRLALMRLKIEEYNYIDIKNIYSDEPIIHF